MHSNFDDKIRSAMSNHVADDGNADAVWAEMAPKIKVGTSSASTGISTAKVVLGVISLAIVGSVTGYFALNNPETPQPDLAQFTTSHINTSNQNTPTLTTDTIKEEQASVKESKVNEEVAKPEQSVFNEAVSEPVNEPKTTSKTTKTSIVEKRTEEDINISKVQHTPEVHWSKDGYCIHELAACSIANPIENARYTWTFSDGSTFEGTHVKKRMNTIGQISGKVAMITDESTAQEHSVNSVTVWGIPKVKFNSSPSTNPREAAITFSAYTSHVGTYLWRFGDQYTSTEERPAHRYTNKGIYQVTLVFTSNAGCTDSVKRMVRVHKAYNLMAESVFDPSKETWMPAGLRDPNTTFELQVYTDNGTPVFKTTSCEEVWDGTNTVTGDVAEVGTMYIWVASVLNEAGVPEKYSGTILVTNKP